MFGTDETNSGMWLVLIIFFILFGGNGFGNRDSFSQFASNSQANEILLGQKFDALGTKINAIGDGICSSTYALNNAIVGEGRTAQTCCCETNRNIDSVRYDNAQNTNAILMSNAEQTQKILDVLASNRMADMQNQINQLQLQASLCNIPRINTYGYNVVPSFPQYPLYGTTIS